MDCPRRFGDSCIERLRNSLLHQWRCIHQLVILGWNRHESHYLLRCREYLRRGSTRSELDWGVKVRLRYRRGAPTGFTAVLNTGTGDADLAWTAPALSQTITDYEYRVSLNGGIWGSWISIGSTSTSASFAACSSTSADPCHYQVRAINSIGNGAASSTSGFSIP